MRSLHVSRYTGMVAYCTADGNELFFQLTTKAVEKEPLRYRMPHFMCVSLAEEKPSIMLNMSASDVAITRRKSLYFEETAVVIYDDRIGENQPTPNLEDKSLVLCYGDSPSRDSQLEETLSYLKKISTAKSKAKTGLALVCQIRRLGITRSPKRTKVIPGPAFDTLPTQSEMESEQGRCKMVVFR